MDNKPTKKHKMRRKSSKRTIDSKVPKVKFDMDTTESSKNINGDESNIRKYESQNES
jgi:hypothetical protein